MTNVLLTGAAGFIGSKTAELLIKDGINIVACDNFNDYYDVRLKEHRAQHIKSLADIPFYNIDIENYSDLSKVFENHKFDSVINLAARAGVRYSIENPFVYATTNIIGTLNLLELMHKHSIDQITLASSSSLYAGEETPFNEEMPVNNPISQYAATKKSAEMLCYSYHHLYNYNTAILRYFTVYGPAGRPDMSYFRFIKWIDEGKTVEIFGDGTQSRDFTFVDDIARGTILSTNIKGYQIINLGGGKTPVTINYMIELIEKYLGKKADICYKPFHSADMKETGADISKAENLLEWQPYTSIEDGLRISVEWYLNNKDLVKNIKL